MNLVSIGSDNGLSPIRHQAIIQTNAGSLSTGPLGTNFSEILIEIQNFSFTKMNPKTSSAKWRPFCPGGDELMRPHEVNHGYYKAHMGNILGPMLRVQVDLPNTGWYIDNNCITTIHKYLWCITYKIQVYIKADVKYQTNKIIVINIRISKRSITSFYHKKIMILA